MTISWIVSRDATQGMVRTRPAYRVIWKVLLFSGAVLGGGFAIASCVARTETTLTDLLRQPILAGRNEVIAARYREEAGQARLLAATHLTMAARYRTRQEGDELSPELRTVMEEHCRALAADYEDAAARYETLATSHASLARDAAGTSSRNRSDDREF
jgi:hypothetical protein